MKDKLNNTEKVNILLSALDQRYKSLHTIRERVQSMGIWLLGILIVAGGWLLQNDVVLLPIQVLIYTLGIAGALAVMRLKYLDDLETGFKNQQLVAVRLEKALGLFTPGVFDNESESIYPQKWEHAGKGTGGGKFFQTTYLLLYVGAIFLVIIILLKGSICLY